MGIHGQSVDESNYDVLDVHHLLELGTRLEERIERLKVELIRKYLHTESKVMQDITSRHREENYNE